MERIENTEHVFADDIVLTTSSERELQHNLDKQNIWNMAIRAMEMKYLRKVKGVNRLQRHRNEDIRRELDIQPITEYIEKRQLEWWGHLMRLPNNIPTRRYGRQEVTAK
ncbi:hypothetical protein NQ318_011908 [Aromia moschata]|uniref:Reverse transcriptase domain-containing protein n=1 Tax=Aromia moschata TaxID=1265417 RepID=A0AAV8XJ95_9CUCU|nr:hypothetical protein NQ318_011908 [Aromia moschata]